MTSFSDRIKELGYSSYSDYLGGEHWASFRERIKSTGARCAVCRSKKVELHHKTYERLGWELPQDVVALCRAHHEAVHDWIDKNQKSVSDTDQAILLLTLSLPKWKIPKQPVIALDPNPRVSKNAKKKMARAARRAARKEPLVKIETRFVPNAEEKIKIETDIAEDASKRKGFESQFGKLHPLHAISISVARGGVAGGAAIFSGVRCNLCLKELIANSESKRCYRCLKKESLPNNNRPNGGTKRRRKR